uniref:Nucleoporin Nup54 alpha-helical domain-containing protein n=1 Tax=Clastoptera arizonana TaxID=38151 RepID=A0A1B6DMA8_9HEMI
MAFNLGSNSMFGSTTTGSSTFGFGSATTTTAARPFGQSTFSFGTPAATTSTFSLGTSTPSTGFGFGQNTSNTTGFGGFGAATTPNTTTTGGFGTFSGFGTTPSTSTPSFGFGTQAQTAPLFSGFNQTLPSTTSTTSGYGGFGTFGKPLGTAAPQTGFGGFGTGLTTTTPFGQGLNQPQQQQQPNNQANSALEVLSSSIFKVNIFSDERDQVLKEWNLLQAFWGFGKGYYSPNLPPVEYTQENPLCCFKAIGYCRKPTAEAKDGFVAIIFNKKDSEIRSQESQLAASFSSLLGNKPNLNVCIESIKPLSDTKTQLLIYVEEKLPNGKTKRVSNLELVNFFLQPMQKQNLTNAGIQNVYVFVAADQEQIKEYLETPPAGIDPNLWKQGQLDNPDPEKFLPVPMVGFDAVRWKSKCQEQETKVHQAVLDQIAENIAELKRRNCSTIAKIAEYRHKVMQLEHRMLKVLVKQEVTRNIGTALRPEEEVLNSQLESLQSKINTPSHFKGRLNELLSLVRMQRLENSNIVKEKYYMDPTTQEEVYKYLSEQHKAMVHVMDTVNSDLKDLKIMTQGLQNMVLNNS